MITSNFYNNRDEWSGEEVWAYIKEKTTLKVRKDYYDTGATIENVWIEIMDEEDKPLLTGTLY